MKHDNNEIDRALIASRTRYTGPNPTNLFEIKRGADALGNEMWIIYMPDDLYNFFVVHRLNNTNIRKTKVCLLHFHKQTGTD